MHHLFKVLNQLENPTTTAHKAHLHKFLSNFQTPSMAATRILRMPKPLGLYQSHNPSMVSRTQTVIMCLNKVGLNSDNLPGGGGGERKLVAVKAAGCSSAKCVLVSEAEKVRGVDLALLLAFVADKILSPWMTFIRKQRPWRFHVQMFIEKAIIDCRFFTLLAIAGSLLGSVLCFVEGCVLILESHFQYFHSLSQMSDQGHVVPMLIEAIDMFLVGTAMLIFGMALHVMFVGQHNLVGKGSQHSGSRNFNLQKLLGRIGIDSPVQAKSKLGHAVIMILQVQVLEKLNNIPVSSGMDLACFAGAVFLSSATIFLLSKIATAPSTAER